MPDLNRTYHRNEDVVARSVAGETLLIPIRGALADMRRIFALNEVAEFVWNELAEPRTGVDLVARVRAAFTADADADVDADVAGFLDWMSDEDLVAGSD